MFNAEVAFITKDKWFYALDVKSLRDGVNPVPLERGEILLIMRDDDIYAISNKCAHMGCSLSTGSLDGFVLKCPCHDWRYDVRTGVFLDAKEINIPTYDVKKENGKVYVKPRRRE